MPDRTVPDDYKASCKVLLERAALGLKQAREERDDSIRIAHNFGLSNVAIGYCLGLSEARIRQILAAGGNR